MHTRQARLHFERTIDKLDHRVNDTLRVNNYVDTFIWNSKEPMRLQYLQAFIHQRRRVYRNLGTHTPCRMCKGLLHRH